MIAFSYEGEKMGSPYKERRVLKIYVHPKFLNQRSVENLRQTAVFLRMYNEMCCSNNDENVDKMPFGYPWDLGFGSNHGGAIAVYANEHGAVVNCIHNQSKWRTNFVTNGATMVLEIIRPSGKVYIYEDPVMPMVFREWISTFSLLYRIFMDYLERGYVSDELCDEMGVGYIAIKPDIYAPTSVY